MTQQRRHDSPFYGQIPSKLIGDKKVCRGAKVYFSHCHSLRGEKDFRRSPSLVRYVSQKAAARTLGCNEKTISRYSKQLRERGWISVRNRGWQWNLVILHGKRKRREERRRE